MNVFPDLNLRLQEVSVNTKTEGRLQCLAFFFLLVSANIAGHVNRSQLTQ